MSNAADEAKVKSDREKAIHLRKQEIEDLRYLLKTAQGRRFFARFLREGKIFQTTFTGNSNTFFLEGHRNLALKFFNDICEAAPECVAELMITKEGEE